VFSLRAWEKSRRATKNSAVNAGKQSSKPKGEKGNEMVGAIASCSLSQNSLGPLSHREPCDPFDAWFSRSRRILHFVACRVLGRSEGAELAIHNCWLTASQERPGFEREGAFRSWLVRVLITEALEIRRQDRK
jgi:hypothetical protein